MHLYDAASLSERDFNEILSFLRSGGVVGFPTDTAYGLGADCSSELAIRRLFEIKGRPETKPILLLVSSLDMVEEVGEVSSLVRNLAGRLWPGPLTMVLPASSTVSQTLTAGTGTIGVRWPDAAFARRLVDGIGRPVTATSANMSGLPAPATAEGVRAQLEGKLEMLIDGGTLPWPGGSTVLDLTQDPPLLLREGPISFQTLHEALGGHIGRPQPLG